MNSLFEEEKATSDLSSGYLLVFHHCRVSELGYMIDAVNPFGTFIRWIKKIRRLDAFLGLGGSVPDIVLRDNDFGFIPCLKVI